MLFELSLTVSEIIIEIFLLHQDLSLLVFVQGSGINTDPSDNLLIQYEFMLPNNLTDILTNEDISDQELLNQFHYNNFYYDNLSRNDFINMYNNITTNSTSIDTETNARDDNISSSVETDD